MQNLLLWGSSDHIKTHTKNSLYTIRPNLGLNSKLIFRGRHCNAFTKHAYISLLTKKVHKNFSCGGVLISLLCFLYLVDSIRWIIVGVLNTSWSYYIFLEDCTRHRVGTPNDANIVAICVQLPWANYYLFTYTFIITEGLYTVF